MCIYNSGLHTIDKVGNGTLEEFNLEIEKPFERIGSNYFYIHNESMTNWFGAVEMCREFNGHLVNLQNDLEITKIATRLNKSLAYWTDLNNLADSTRFYSLTTGYESEFYNQPAHGHYQCGYMHFDESAQKFVLSTQHCISTLAYPICQTIKPIKLDFIFW